MESIAGKFATLDKDAVNEMLVMAADCIRGGFRQRPELAWLKARYEEKRMEYGLKKADMDVLIYTRMYGCKPKEASELLKVRYWRTGQHMPLNRETCLRFCRALEMDAAGTSYMLTAYMDTSREYYECEPAAGTDKVYWTRRQLLEELTRNYLHFYDASKDGTTKVSLSRLRHLYYLNALQYHPPVTGGRSWDKPIYSINYDTEFRRNLLLLGEIPRCTMLRHLILLMLPELSLQRLQEALIEFGYLPLSPAHTLRGGEHLDRLLLHMIKLYEEIDAAEGSASAAGWFLYCYRCLDTYFVEHQATGFRFLHFKTLDR